MFTQAAWQCDILTYFQVSTCIIAVVVWRPGLVSYLADYSSSSEVYVMYTYIIVYVMYTYIIVYVMYAYIIVCNERAVHRGTMSASCNL